MGVANLLCKQEVVGSIPSGSTTPVPSTDLKTNRLLYRFGTGFCFVPVFTSLDDLLHA